MCRISLFFGLSTFIDCPFTDYNFIYTALDSNQDSSIIKTCVFQLHQQCFLAFTINVTSISFWIDVIYFCCYYKWAREKKFNAMANAGCGESDVSTRRVVTQ